MPENQTLPLQKVTPKSADEDLCPHTRSLSSLLDAIKKYMVVDAAEVIAASSVIVTGSEPGPADRAKLWVDRNEGFLAVWDGGKWEKLYIHGYPKNTPFKYCAKPIPNYLRKVAPSTISAEGLGENTDDCTWVIFNPGGDATI